MGKIEHNLSEIELILVQIEFLNVEKFELKYTETLYSLIFRKIEEKVVRANLLFGLLRTIFWEFLRISTLLSQADSCSSSVDAPTFK